MVEQELRRRGVQASLSSLIETCSLDGIKRTIEWWDRQPGAGPGSLVETIRQGGVIKPRNATTLAQQQREYGEQIVTWLSKNFPEFDRPGWGPHPAAVAAVIRLHYRDGKGSLTKRRHGPEIRAAVKRWEKEMSE